MEPISTLDWVERLGGWGVVLIVVRWMMGRMDSDRVDHQATVKQLVDSMTSAVESFRHFEVEEKKTHETIERQQGQILDEIRRLGKSEI